MASCRLRAPRRDVRISAIAAKCGSAERCASDAVPQSHRHRHSDSVVHAGPRSRSSRVAASREIEARFVAAVVRGLWRRVPRRQGGSLPVDRNPFASADSYPRPRRPSGRGLRGSRLAARVIPPPIPAPAAQCRASPLQSRLRQSPVRPSPRSHDTPPPAPLHRPAAMAGAKCPRRYAARRAYSSTVRAEDSSKGAAARKRADGNGMNSGKPSRHQPLATLSQAGGTPPDGAETT